MNDIILIVKKYSFEKKKKITHSRIGLECD